jgi:hypothetical protein
MKLIGVSLFTILSATAYGQINIINESLTDDSKNIFYIGVDNRIRISVFDDNYSMAITGGGGTIQKTGKGQYVVRVTAVTDLCELFVLKGTRNIFRKPYVVRTINDPVATLSGIRDTTVSRNRILLNPNLSIVIPNCYFRFNYRVVSFSASFINDQDSITTFSNGNILSPEQINLVKNAVTGSNIYFDNIRGMGADDRTRKFYPFWIKIQ